MTVDSGQLTVDSFPPNCQLSIVNLDITVNCQLSTSYEREVLL